MLRLIVALVALVIVLAIGAMVVAFAIYQSSRRRVGYIPLPQRAVPAAIKALSLPTTTDAYLYDLGCGDGRILAAALRHHAKLRGVGIELNPLVATVARRKLRGMNAIILRGNLLKADLRPPTHVFTYLNHPTMAALEPKLAQELAPGARLVSCDFPLPQRQPNRIITIGHRGQLGQKLYVYEY